MLLNCLLGTNKVYLNRTELLIATPYHCTSAQYHPINGDVGFWFKQLHVQVQAVNHDDYPSFFGIKLLSKTKEMWKMNTLTINLGFIFKHPTLIEIPQELKMGIWMNMDEGMDKRLTNHKSLISQFCIWFLWKRCWHVWFQKTSLSILIIPAGFFRRGLQCDWITFVLGLLWETTSGADCMWRHRGSYDISNPEPTNNTSVL